MRKGQKHINSGIKDKGMDYGSSSLSKPDEGKWWQMTPMIEVYINVGWFGIFEFSTTFLINNFEF